MSPQQYFFELHQRPGGFMIGNVWNAASASAAKDAGFEALGTSSAAMAAEFGYADGEQMPFEHVLSVVKSIQTVTDLPLSVDIEGGYSRNSEKIAQHVFKLCDMGVVGINLEDSVVEQQRTLLDAHVIADTVRYLKQVLAEQGKSLFINLRTDTYLLHPDNALDLTLQRLKTYQDSGADGLFIPGLTQPDDIQCILEELHIPLNLMSLPNLTELEPLQQLGVKRFSMGNFAYAASHAHLQSLLNQVYTQQSFKCLFAS